MSWDAFVHLDAVPTHPIITLDSKFPVARDPFVEMLYSYGAPGTAYNEHLAFLMRALTVQTIFPGSDPFYNARTNMSLHDYATQVANKPVGLDDGMQQRILWGPGGGRFYTDVMPKARAWYNCSLFRKREVGSSLIAGYTAQYAGTNFHEHSPVANVLLRGSKLWLMYPPHMAMFIATAVHEMQPPLHTIMQLMHKPTLPRPMGCIQRAGTMLFVPDKWWHATVNLDKSLSVGCTT